MQLFGNTKPQSGGLTSPPPTDAANTASATGFDSTFSGARGIGELESVCLMVKSGDETMLTEVAKMIESGFLVELFHSLQSVMRTLTRSSTPLNDLEAPAKEMRTVLRTIELIYGSFHASSPQEMAYLTGMLPQLFDQGIRSEGTFNLTPYRGLTGANDMDHLLNEHDDLSQLILTSPSAPYTLFPFTCVILRLVFIACNPYVPRYSVEFKSGTFTLEAAKGSTLKLTDKVSLPMWMPASQSSPVWKWVEPLLSDLPMAHKDRETGHETDINDIAHRQCRHSLAQAIQFILSSLYSGHLATKLDNVEVLSSTNQDQLFQGVSGYLESMSNIMSTGNSVDTNHVAVTTLETAVRAILFDSSGVNRVKLLAVHETSSGLLTTCLSILVAILHRDGRDGDQYIKIMPDVFSCYRGIASDLGFSSLTYSLFTTSSNTAPFVGYPNLLIVIFRFTTALLSSSRDPALVDEFLIPGITSDIYGGDLNVSCLFETVYHQWDAAMKGTLMVNWDDVKRRISKFQRNPNSRIEPSRKSVAGEYDFTDVHSSDQKTSHMDQTDQARGGNLSATDYSDIKSDEQRAMRAAAAWLDPNMTTASNVNATVGVGIEDHYTTGDPMIDATFRRDGRELIGPVTSDILKCEFAMDKVVDGSESFNLNDFYVWAIQYLFLTLLDLINTGLDMHLSPTGVTEVDSKFCLLLQNSKLSKIHDVAFKLLTVHGPYLMPPGEVHALNKSSRHLSKAIALELLGSSAIASNDNKRMQLLISLSDRVHLAAIQTDIQHALASNSTNGATSGVTSTPTPDPQFERLLCAFVDMTTNLSNLMPYNVRFQQSAVDADQYGESIRSLIKFTNQSILPLVVDRSKSNISNETRWRLAIGIYRFFFAYLRGPMPASGNANGVQDLTYSADEYGQSTRPTGFLFENLCALDSSIMSSLLKLMDECAGNRGKNFAAGAPCGDIGSYLLSMEFLCVGLSFLRVLFNRDDLFCATMVARSSTRHVQLATNALLQVDYQKESDQFSTQLELLLYNVLLPIFFANCEPGMRFWELIYLTSGKTNGTEDASMKDLLIRRQALDIFMVLVTRLPGSIKSLLSSHSELHRDVGLQKALTGIVLRPRGGREENQLITLVVDTDTSLDKKEVLQRCGEERIAHAAIVEPCREGIKGGNGVTLDMNSSYGLHLSFRNISFKSGTCINQTHFLKADVIDQRLVELNDQEHITNMLTRSPDEPELKAIQDRLIEMDELDHDLRLLRLYQRALMRPVDPLTPTLCDDHDLGIHLLGIQLGRSSSTTTVMTKLPLVAIEQLILEGILTLDNRFKGVSSTMEKAKIACMLLTALLSHPHTSAITTDHVYHHLAPRWDGLISIIRWTTTTRRDAVKLRDVEFFSVYLQILAAELRALVTMKQRMEGLTSNAITLAEAVSDHIIGYTSNSSTVLDTLNFVWTLLRDMKWEAPEQTLVVLKSCIQSSITLASASLDLAKLKIKRHPNEKIKRCVHYVQGLQRFFHPSSMLPNYGMTEPSQFQLIDPIFDHIEDIKARATACATEVKATGTDEIIN